jgi:Fe-S cluster biosynthesis and repair protein YggX
MGLLVDDILFLPGTIGKIIFSTLSQTVEKVAWTEYNGKLKKMLLRARHDLDNNKIDRVKYKEIESYVFTEMRRANKALASKKD